MGNRKWEKLSYILCLPLFLGRGLCCGNIVVTDTFSKASVWCILSARIQQNYYCYCIVWSLHFKEINAAKKPFFSTVPLDHPSAKR